MKRTKYLHVFNGIRTWNNMAIIQGILKAERHGGFSIGEKYIYVDSRSLCDLYVGKFGDEPSIHIVRLPKCRIYRELVALHILLHSYRPLVFHGHEVLAIWFSKLFWTCVTLRNWGLSEDRISSMTTAKEYARIDRVQVNMGPEKRILEHAGVKNVKVLPYFANLNLDLHNVASRQDLMSYKILLGNNCHSAKDYLRYLYKLERFKDRIEEVSCVISYGGVDSNKECVARLKTEGARIFGDKFKPSETLLSSDEYRKFQSRFDIYIAPTIVQGGLNTIYAQIAFGSTIFLDGVNFEWLTESGCAVHSCKELDDEKFELSIDSVATQDANRRAIVSLIDEFGPIDGWRESFS